MRKKILIVEDDLDLVFVLEAVLKKHGHEIKVAENPGDLLNGSFDIPDLFILDRYLGNYDGLEICRTLKKTEATKMVPVLMISSMPDIVDKAREAGADSSVTKPFEIRSFVKSVNQMLGILTN